MHRRRTVLALLAASTAHALPNDLFAIAAREVCPKDAVVCAAPLPLDFCCPKNTRCESLAGDTTALCCPVEGDCQKIQPIACNVLLQDPKEHADGPLFTSVFDVDLPKCGNSCCPFGYTCVDNTCRRDSDQSKKPSKSSATSSPSAPSSTSTASSTTTSTAAPSHATTTATPSSDATHGGGMDSMTISIIGGTVGGGILIISVLVIIFLCIRRRKKRTPRSKSASSGGGPSRVNEKPGTDSSSASSSSVRARGFLISEPIRQEEPPYRTDFAALKSPSAASSISQQPVNARWSGSGGSGAPGARHLTPPVRPPREPSFQPRQQQQSFPPTRLRPPSFPNPFNSPIDGKSDVRESIGSSFYDNYTDDPKTGHVVSHQPVRPIRGMNTGRRLSRCAETGELQRQPSSESIDVFADENTISPLRPQQQYQHQQLQSGWGVHEARDRDTTYTTMTGLMEEAGLGDVRRGERFVPGTAPRRK